jgi:ribosomal protein S3
MGQKVNPISMRLQVNRDWRSKWFAGKREYATYLNQDLAARRYIDKKLGTRAAINKVDIERSPNLVTVTIQTAKASGAKGVRIEVAGRLNGNEMSRREKESQGSVPLHTIRADIDYAAARALYPGAGIIGIKVWIYKGEIQ